jgi:thiamine-phosphate pyrophosphorylase
MPEAQTNRCRLCLVTPLAVDPAAFAPRLDDALAGGDVASLIIASNASDPSSLQQLAEALVPIAQSRGVAALIRNDTRIAGRTGADGVHIDSGHADLTAAIEAFHPRKIVGAGGVFSRHEAMIAGEANPDYLFFGRLDGDRDEAIFPKALDLAEWWSEIMVIPAIVMGGSALASVRQAAENGIEFVALGRAVWDHANGPGAAVEEANRLLSAVREAVP